MSRITLSSITGLTVAAAASAAAAGQASFSNQTGAAGINVNHSPTYSESFLAGGAVGDFDGDGYVDIFVPVGGGGPDRLYMNNQDGTFTDRAARWGVALTHRSTAAAVGDYDGDGMTDLYVTSLGPAGGDQTGHHKLYRNNGNGSFTDMASVAGVNFTSIGTADGFGAAFGDYDLDGDLDLAAAGWRFGSNGNRLFRNDGNGTFTDVTATSGLNGISGVFGFAPRFVDLDGDVYPELILIGDFGTSKYYTNDGDGTFTDQTNPSGMGLDGTEMGITVADMDHDQLFDVYVTTISTNNLYMNQGNHQFLNQAAQSGCENTGWGWGTVAIDFDHDTWPDLVATTQSNRQYAFVNTTANTGSLSFDEVALSIGINTSISGRGLSNLDYDNDGDQDLVFFPHQGPVTLFRNDLSGPDINWLRVVLDRGTATDIAPGGIGSVVRISHGGQTYISRIDGGSNYLSQSEMAAHFGLGADTMVDEVIVDWTNGQTTALTNVSANQTLTVTPVDDPVLGDLDDDGLVGIDDLLIMLAAWGDCPGVCPPACNGDLDGNCTVNVGDLLQLLAGWS